MSFYYNQPLNDMYYTMYPQPPQDTATYYNYDMSLDQLPVFEYNNALQDDNFSIATASDLYPQLTSPSLLSVGDMNMQQMTPSSTPSPQLTTIYHHQRNTSFDSFFFAPMAPDSPPKRRVSSGSMTEKRHICPICNHRSKRRHNLVEHMLTHNPHRPKSFLCSHCSRPFARKYDMKRHEKIHLKK